MADERRLKAAVYVQDPDTREELVLLPGECPPPEVAALITNPDAWEGQPEGCEQPLTAETAQPPADKPDGQAEPAVGGGAKKRVSSRRSGGRPASASS